MPALISIKRRSTGRLVDEAGHTKKAAETVGEAYDELLERYGKRNRSWRKTDHEGHRSASLAAQAAASASPGGLTIRRFCP